MEEKKKNPWDFFKRRYVISLPQSKDRRESVHQELSKVNMDFEFVDAIDGRVNFEELRKECYTKNIIGDRGLKEFTPGALGCLLSHRNVFEKAYGEAKGEDCWFLIMEDDIQFSSRLMDNLQNYIDNWPSKTSLVKLGYWNNYNPNYKKEVENPYFVELTAQTTCTVCYAIRTELLPHLIKKKYDTAIDTIVDYPMYGFKTIEGESKDFLRREYFDAYFEGVCSEKKTLASTIVDYREDKKQANPWNFFKRRYVISLPQSKDRREYVTKELEKVNMDFEFFDAVDGRKEYENLRTSCLEKNIIGQKAYDELSPGALGCLLSHRGIYEKEYLSMKPGDDYWILIMEDDVEFAPGLYEEMPKYIQHWPEKSNIVKLIYWNKDPTLYTKEIDNPYFIELVKYTNGTMAYAMHSSEFKVYLDHVFNTAIDMVVDYPMHGFRTLKHLPNEYFRVSDTEHCYFEGVGRENNKQLPSTIGEHQNKMIHIGTSTTNIKYIPIENTNPNAKYRIFHHPYNDRFELRTENNMLIVRRVDADCGWGFPHRAVVVDITPDSHSVQSTSNPWNFFKRRYVISLPQSKDRRESVKEEMNKVNMDFEFFDAVDGREDYEGLRNYYKQRGILSERVCKELTPGALGCLLSHYKIFEREHKLQGDEKYWILIMEDDIKFAPNIYNQLQNYFNHWPTNTKFVKLAYWNNYTKGFKQECGNPYFVELKSQTCGCLCYAIHSDLFSRFVYNKYDTAIDLIVEYPMYGFKTPPETPKEFFKMLANYGNAMFEGICAEKYETLPSTIGSHMKNPVIEFGSSKENIKRIKLDRVFDERALVLVQSTPYSDKFNIRIEKDELVVRRIDVEEGWGYNHKATIIETPPTFYCSMTTIPSRFANIHKTIDSLLNQSFPPKQIILNIPKQYGFRFDNQSIPQSDIDKLQRKYGTKLRIHMMEEDYGPGSKLLGALECEDISDDAYIILVDDDMLYCDFLKHYIVGIDKFPVFSACVEEHQGIDLKIGQGVNGFLMKKELLNRFQKYYEVIKDNTLIKHHDDLFISYYFKLIGISVERLPVQVYLKEHSDTPDSLVEIHGVHCRFNALWKGYRELVDITNKDHKFDFLTN
jgi:GR25 family glycosyltransferase involved in LPS biosynthesis